MRVQGPESRIPVAHSAGTLCWIVEQPALVSSPNHWLTAELTPEKGNSAGELVRMRGTGDAPRARLGSGLIMQPFRHSTYSHAHDKVAPGA